MHCITLTGVEQREDDGGVNMVGDDEAKPDHYYMTAERAIVYSSGGACPRHEDCPDHVIFRL